MVTDAAPLISVIIPTRDAAGVIDACLRSLATQRFKDFDVWIMDGGSRDETMRLAQAYDGHLGTALHLRQAPDQGAYDAMNQGIAQSLGAWLYFMGADDLLHDAEVFADMAVRMQSGGVDMLYGDVINKATGARYGGEWTLDRLLFKANICHQALFYRREVFQRLGGFNLRYPIWADWELNIRCFRHPELRSCWADRLVAVYNNNSGLSRREDPVFSKELPVTLLRDARRDSFCLRGVARRLGAMLSWRGRR